MYNLCDYIEKLLLRDEVRLQFTAVRMCVCVCVRVCVSQSIAKSKHKAAPVLPITLSLINHEREYSESNFIVRCNIP